MELLCWKAGGANLSKQLKVRLQIGTAQYLAQYPSCIHVHILIKNVCCHSVLNKIWWIKFGNLAQFTKLLVFVFLPSLLLLMWSILTFKNGHQIDDVFTTNCCDNISSYMQREIIIAKYSDINRYNYLYFTETIVTILQRNL